MRARPFLACLLLLAASHVGAATVSPVVPIAVRVTDAEYSAALDAIVTVDGTALTVHLTATHESHTVALPRVGLCVSVSPDGQYAAVGHDAAMTLVRLDTRAVIGEADLDCVAGDIVLAGNGYAYVCPRPTGSWSPIRCVELATGEVHDQTGASPYTGLRARLHPAGLAIYGGQTGLSPADFMRFDVAGGVAVHEHDSRYHGDYPMGGDLWFTEDGTTLIGSSGACFSATAAAGADLEYRGTLSGVSRLRWAAHSVETERLLAIADDATRDSVVRCYTGPHRAYRGDIGLPRFPGGSSGHAVHARHVFLDQDGAVAHVLVQADLSSGLLWDWGIVSIDLAAAAAPVAAIAWPQPGSVLGSSFDLGLVVSGWTRGGGAVSRLRIDGVDTGEIGDRATVAGLAVGAHTLQAVLLDGAGAEVAASDPVAVVVAIDAPGVLRLPYRVLDAEYAAAPDRLVLLEDGGLRLHVIDAATSATTAAATVTLPLPGACVGLSPLGDRAAVGHDGWISVVDLVAGAVIATRTMPCVVGDVMLSGNGWAYALPARDQWVSAYGLELSTGSVHSSYYLYAGSQGRLHPDGEAFYCTLPLGPDDFIRFDIATGPPARLRESPYHGEYVFGGNLWMSGDGLRIFGQAGNVFRSSAAADQDLIYNGSLGTGYVHWVDHAMATGTVMAMPMYPQGQLRFLDYATLTRLGSRDLPSLASGSGAIVPRGRFAFHGADGGSGVAIVRADTLAFPNTDAIVLLDLEDVRAPAAPGISATPGAGSATIAWTAPGDDGAIGVAASYDLRYAPAVLGPLDWETATRAAGEPSPATAGTPESFVLEGLAAGLAYHVALVARDDAGNWSLSNIVMVTPQHGPPMITSAGAATGQVGEPFSYAITASSAPAVLGASGLPAGLAVGADGVISGTPATAGSWSVTLSAGNGFGTTTATLAITILPARPAIGSATAAFGMVGEHFTYATVASGSPHGYAASPLPPGLAIDATSGIISGVPTASGIWTVLLSATNAGGTGHRSLGIAILPAAGDPPDPAIDEAVDAGSDGSCGLGAAAALLALVGLGAGRRPGRARPSPGPVTPPPARSTAARGTPPA